MVAMADTSFAVILLRSRPAVASAATMLMIATTIKSSINVNPDSAGFAVRG
jgi:hypothetical protein